MYTRRHNTALMKLAFKNARKGYCFFCLLFRVLSCQQLHFGCISPPSGHDSDFFWYGLLPLITLGGSSVGQRLPGGSSATAPAALGQGVTHPSTNQAQCCLTSVIEWEQVFQHGYGRWAPIWLIQFITRRSAQPNNHFTIKFNFQAWIC